MKERKILHIDINHCYAQIMEMLYPQLKEVPMAVGGSEASRHGIILARNLLAKAKGVKTAESVREALSKCPELVVVPPQMKLFQYYTNQIKDLYREYTPLVESFGLDEAWVDVTHCQWLFGDAVGIAKTIQQRILDEFGLTVSIGVSFNKVLAKLGSDLIKPSGLVIIDEKNFRNIIKTIPVQNLLMVGPATTPKLNKLNIHTVGDLAEAPLNKLKQQLGKHGELIWYFANGGDMSDVLESGSKKPIKSVGNSVTTPADITCYKEAEIVFQVLSESVASRLREANLAGKVVSISIRDNSLAHFSRQMKLSQKTNLASEIMQAVDCLLKAHYDFKKPLRSIGITVSDLSVDEHGFQLDFFSNPENREKQRKLEESIDYIRHKYGFNKIQRLSVYLNRQLTDFNPKGDHTIFPASWF